jgi:eukaryotic-like serine/threonine-protein kinase
VIAPSERLAAALSDRYRIERELGRGGMATVYLAEDLKHRRRVAVKVLKPELAAVLGADRFVQEITTTAALQHPHILPLFDSGEADGFLFYVMPFIDGETLRAKLDRETQLGVDEAVRIACDVADALHHAHSNRVIHRDIKPENILLANGRPMVADFGIALAVSAAAGGRMTETGLSLGTPHYMSPEQATAEKEISARSDVYSLASVLYEMLTGNPPHTGSSAQQIIMKIITDTPRPVTELRKSVPANVAAAIAKALEKLPADRFDSAHAFAQALSNPAFTFATGMVSNARSARAGGDWRLIALGAALAVMTFVAIGALLQPAPPQPVRRYSVRLPDDQTLSGFYSRIALSADGFRLVYVAGNSAHVGLWVRDRDKLESMPLPGTAGAQTPFFSPDGERVAYLGDGRLRTVPLRGGQAVLLADSLVGSAGGTWSSDGFIYADGFGAAPLVRVPTTGDGGARWFTQLDQANGETDHVFPDALPNGRGVIFTVVYGSGGDGIGDRNIAVASTGAGTHRVLFKGTFARNVRSGHIVYVTAEGALMAVRFDQDAMQVRGEPVALSSGITLRTFGIPDLAIANDGTLMYTIGGAAQVGGEPVWVERDGRAEPIMAGWTRDARGVALSPDGTQLAVAISNGSESHIWVRELARGRVSRLTFSGSFNARPTWSPDGRSVVYVANPGPAGELWSRRGDGTAEAELLLAAPTLRGGIASGSVTRDGQWILYRSFGGGVGRVFARRTSGDTTLIALSASVTSLSSPAVSPDGRWLTYVSSETGRDEVYVRPFPELRGGQWLVSVAGGNEPLWSRDGRELFYRNARGEMVATAVLPDGAPLIGEQRVLFSSSAFTSDPRQVTYDVTPDGRRFVMTRVAPDGAGAETQLIVVENFFEELKRRVPR